jgi:N6-adenosine-specific RNA methylase IME4
MSVWRITVWLPERPEIRRQVRYQGNCKLCAIAKAVGMAESSAKAHNRNPEGIAWTVEKMTGHLGYYDIRYTHQSRVGPWVMRHGH